MPLYIYHKTEPGVWSVGYYADSGDWISESQCINAEEAALHAHWLNIDRKDSESEDIRNNI
ncbi:hypothetical protein [Caproiciproducens galactitolivorans]|uniref:DUF2188 domain-containing protein n=1 Tax=Caproiciproducens galactitolivorans TaxID=642589 RepID=A0ABT4BUG2_9FIRM|nr:hypothetical protein [Caproiciproducens galactitolivorans]MCY1713548.1 hypothetical protein [Caproiciproducens galactitolivorans]